MSSVRILVGDVRERLADLPDNSVHCVVTSPPYYGLRAYGTKPVTWDDGWRGELGSEPSLDRYVAHLVAIFRDVKRVLRDDGTLFLNIGDSYNAYNGNRGHSRSTLQGRRQHERGLPELPAGSGLSDVSLKPKDLMLVPFRVALALQADGWWVRSDIIWSKKAPMPESVTDRPTRSHEYIFLLSKSARYYYDGDAIREPYNPDSIGRYQYEMQGTAPTAHQPNGNIERREHEKGAREPNPAGRNARTVWHLSPEPPPDAHFATFPTEVPRRAILAGTSERGCCAACSAPWRRVTERGGQRATHGPNYVADQARGRHGATSVFYSGLVPITETTGWQPTCSCTTDAPPIPCTVLDIFSGSGTTGVVASRLGRDYIGIELNPDYAAMSERRIREEGSPLFADVATEDAEPDVPALQQMAFA